MDIRHLVELLPRLTYRRAKDTQFIVMHYLDSWVELEVSESALNPGDTEIHKGVIEELIGRLSRRIASEVPTEVEDAPSNKNAEANQNETANSDVAAKEIAQGDDCLNPEFLEQNAKDIATAVKAIDSKATVKKILTQERKGKNRSTVIEALEKQIETL